MDLQAITTQVTRIESAVDAAGVAFRAIAAELLSHAGDEAAVRAIGEQLSAQADELSAAIVSGTPAAPGGGGGSVDNGGEAARARARGGV